VLDVINFLAAQPVEAFSLAEIARRVGLSKGSAHRLLTTMADADFLTRNEKSKTYALGMALVAIGQAALEKYRGLDVARREMARLTVELNAQCTATALVGDDLMILAKEGLPQSHEGLNRVGERRPLIPPMGLCHIAWGEAEVVEKYLSLAAQHMNKKSYARLRDALKLIRHRGFAMGANGPYRRVLRQVTVSPIGEVRDADYWSSAFALIRQLTPNEVQIPSFSEIDANGVPRVTAPVFSPEGSVAFQLVLSGFPFTIAPKKLERYVERLCSAAASITNELNGRMPHIREG
jgi:DNA-binding IclR family transcriptional regulator